MRQDIPAVGQSYQHTDIPLSVQSTKNWFPEVNRETTKILTLQPWPGATVFSQGAGAGRGMTVWRDTLYKVSGDTLYRIDRNGSQTAIGAIPGAMRCTFPASLEYMVIVTSGKAFLYDGTTLSEITDPELESPTYGAFLLNFWIYRGQEGRFWHSDAGQPDQINGLNFGTAETDGDSLQRPYVYDEKLMLIGSKTIEHWWADGVGNPKFSRIQSGVLEKGCIAPDSVDSNDTSVYFLGDDMHVYRVRGMSEQSVSTIPLSRLFETYRNPDKAVGFCMEILGQFFYVLTIDGHTWVYNQNAGGWFELTVGYEESPYPATDYERVYDKHLIEDGGSVLELSTDTALYREIPVVRERITGTISGETFGAENIGRRIFMSRTEIIIKGLAPLGDPPQVMLSWSDDAGYTWSNERILTCGRLGDYTWKAVTHQLGRFYERVFKIRISDENRYSIHRMSGDFELGN